MSRNANLNAYVDPLDFETVPVAGPWKRVRVALVPEPAQVVGQRLTYTQIARDQIPQLFERVGFGSVSFGLIEGPEHLSETSELVPLTHDHLPLITPGTVIAASDFRRSIAKTVSDLSEALPWRFVLCRDQILAALGRLNGPPKDRAPWYEHLPVEGPRRPVRTEAHRRARTADLNLYLGNGNPEVPYVPVDVEAMRLEGAWKHQNVIALLPHPSCDTGHVLTYDGLRQMGPADLLERMAYGGFECRLGDSEDPAAYLSTLSSVDLPRLVPEATVDAADFVRDPWRAVDRLRRDRSLRHLFLRTGNQVFGRLWLIPLETS